MRPESALAAAEVGGRSLYEWFGFWAPGAVVAMLLSAWLFREQFAELTTLRFLERRIAPFFPEFDPPAVTKWVARAAPHVFHAWRTRDPSQMSGVVTPRFDAALEARSAADAHLGHSRPVRFESVLKVHPLSAALVGQGPAPADVALYLRVELNGVDCVRGPDGRLVAGRDELLQLQQFWTLVHDGTQWRLDAVEEARADAQDLPKVTALPPLLEWRRPAPEGDEN